MEETVECGECGNRYDSNAQPFCPRCGSDSGRGQVSLQPRDDPGRRRARAGGIILLVLGGLVLLQSAWTLIAPPSPDAEQLQLLADIDLLREQPGGDVVFQVLEAGMPVDGATVTWAHLNGTVVSNGTTVAGYANQTGLASAFMNATVAYNGSVWYRHIYVPAGADLDVRVDVATAAPDAVVWEAVDQLTATRVLSAFFVLFAAFVVLGGIMALRLRAWGLAIAAAALVVVPALLVAIVIPVAGILFLLPSGLAMAFIAMGRRHFA